MIKWLTLLLWRVDQIYHSTVLKSGIPTSTTTFLLGRCFLKLSLELTWEMGKVQTSSGEATMLKGPVI